jgi:hypothetical protein
MLLTKWGMLVWDVFKGHLRPEIKATISSINTDIPWQVTSQLQVLDI